MKAPTKKAISRFVNDAAKLFADLGFIPGPHGYLRIQTDLGKFEVYPPDDHHFGWYFCINGRFDDAHTAACVLGDSVNCYSGKWNILAHTADQALAEFLRRMGRVHACKPSADDLAEWAEQDAAKAAKWAAALASVSVPEKSNAA